MPTSASEHAELLTVDELTAGYGELRVVEGTALYVSAGELVAVIGPNGAGKSTLLKAIMGIATTHAGTVTVAGVPITGLKTNEVVRHGVGYVPQSGLVFPNLTAEENLEMGAYPVARHKRAKRIAEVTELFPRLAEFRRRRAGLLSGGEQTMLGIARAMINRPRLLLLDEISSGLAPGVIASVWKDLRRLRDLGVAMLLVEQRTKEVLELTSRGYVLVGGKPVLEGSSRSLLEDVDLGAVFLQQAGSPWRGSPTPAHTAESMRSEGERTDRL